MATSVLLNVGVNQTYLLNSLNKAFSKAENDFKGLNLKLNDRAFSQPLGRITGDVNQFTKSLEAATARVVSFSATLGIIGAAAKGFKSIVESTIEVEQRLKEINSVFGLSASGITKFNREIFDAARATGQSFEVASKAALEFSRQGLSVEETLKRVNAALVLSRISGLDANESVSTITTTLNGFNKEALTAVDIINKLASVDAKFSVSTKDLSEALQRVGSTAQDAGVGFDRLLGVITSAKQITGREGAVIGNAIKSIFTRVQRPETIDQLENLGVAVKDLKNNVLPADQVLVGLAKRFDSLTSSQQQYLTELTGGLFQVNQLRALLSDLGKSYSIVDQATKTSANSQNEAIKRNEALNQSLAILLANAQTTGKEIGAAFGNIAIGNPLKKILNPSEGSPVRGVVESIIGGLKKIGDNKAEFENTGEEISKTIGEGLAKGLANIFTGPGAVTAAFLGAKLVGLTTQKIAGALQSLGSSDREGAALKGTEIALNRANQAELNRVNSATTLAEKEAAVLAILEKQQAVIAATAGTRLSQVQSIQQNPAALSIAKKFGRAADGYLPNYVDQERNAIARGVGGASAGAKPVVLPNFNYGGGQRGTLVANTDEYMVPNFARGGSAIFNKKMIASIGLPQGALKIAANGYYPNFAKGPIGLRAGATPIGEGAYGSYMKTQNPNIGFKKFKTNLTDDPQQYILDEFAISKLTSQMGLPVAKAYGSAARSVKRGGIYKEHIEGTLGSKLPDFLKKQAISELRAMFIESGIDPVDLSASRGENFIVRKGANLKDINSIVKNSVIVDPGQFEITNASLLADYSKYRRSKAGGYLPNFANNPLANAINRESAAVDPNSIYLDQDPRLKSSGNPNGLLIANRRDEPSGGFQGVNRVLSQGGNPKMAGAAGGHIPNFADYQYGGLRTAAGYNVSKAEVANLNALFDSLKKAKDQNTFYQLGAQITDFSQKLNKAGFKEVFGKLASQIQIAGKVFQNGVNQFGQTAAPINQPNFAAFPSGSGGAGAGAGAGGGAGGGGGNGGIPWTPYGTTMPAAPFKKGPRFLEETDVEKNFNRNLYNIPNKILEAITGTGTSINKKNKPFEIDTFRDFINSSKGRRFDPAGKDIQGIVDVSRAKTFKSEFVQDVQNEISRSGKGLVEAMQIASKEFLATGGTQKQLRTTILQTTRELDQYESNLRNSQQQAGLSRGVASATRILESGGTLKPGSKPYKALQQVNNLQTEQSFLQSIGKTNVQELTNKESATLARAQRLNESKLIQKLQQPADAVKLYKEIEGSTKGITGFYRGLVTNYTTKAEEIIKTKGYTGEAAQLLRGQASQLESKKQSRLDKAAFIIPFAASMAAGFIPEGQGGTNRGKTLGGLSGGLQGAATGAAIGSVLPFIPGGPITGAIAGGVVGGISGVLSKLNKSLEEFSASISEVNAKYNQQTNSVAQYVQLQQQLNDAIASGASEKDINYISKQQTTAIRGLSLEDRKSLLNSGGNIDKLLDVLRNIESKNQGKTSANQGFEALFKAGDTGGFFSKPTSKSVDNAVETLTASLDLTDEKIKKGLVKLSTDLQSGDYSKAFSNFGESLGKSSSEIEDVLGKFSNYPDELGNIFQRVLDQTNKSLKDENENSKRRRDVALVNVDISRNLSKSSIQRSFQSDIAYGKQQTGIRINERIGQASVEIKNIDDIQKIFDQLSVQLRSITEQGQSTLDKALQDTFSTLEKTISSKPNELQGQQLQGILQVIKSNSPEQLKTFLDQNQKISLDIKTVLEQGVQEQQKISENTKNQVAEAKAFSRVQQVLAGVQQRKEILSKGQFSQERADTSADISLTAKTKVPSKNPLGDKLQSILKEIEDDTSVFVETAFYKAAKENALEKSGNVTLAAKLSDALGEVVTATEDGIREAAKKAKGSSDIFTQQKGIAAEETLRIREQYKDTNAQKALSDIGNQEGLNAFFKSGQNPLQQGFELTAAAIDQSNSLLQKIADNTGGKGGASGGVGTGEGIGSKTPYLDGRLSNNNGIVSKLSRGLEQNVFRKKILEETGGLITEKSSVQKQIDDLVNSPEKVNKGLGFARANFLSSTGPSKMQMFGAGAGSGFINNNITGIGALAVNKTDNEDIKRKKQALTAYLQQDQKEVIPEKLRQAAKDFNTNGDEFVTWAQNFLTGLSDIFSPSESDNAALQDLQDKRQEIEDKIIATQSRLFGPVAKTGSFENNPLNIPTYKDFGLNTPTSNQAGATTQFSGKGLFATPEQLAARTTATGAAGVDQRLSSKEEYRNLALSRQGRTLAGLRTDLSKAEQGDGTDEQILDLKKKILSQEFLIRRTAESTAGTALEIDKANEQIATAKLDQAAAEERGAGAGEMADIQRRINEQEVRRQRVLEELTDAEAALSKSTKDLETLIEERNNGGRVTGAQEEALAMTKAQDAGIAGKSGESLKFGFEARFKGLKADMNDLSQLGATLASSIENNLGNSWGNFVTGAKKGKDAFREFAASITSDAARAFGNKAMQNLLGMAFGSLGGSVSPQGINAKGFASGGSVPSMIMGGEYYISPAAAQRIGKPLLNQINSGSLPSPKSFASGGLVNGGSGVRDDIPTNLPSNSYIIKKSAVNKYGADYLDSLAQGRVQKKFLGGLLIGGLLGAGIGYATGGKKGAIIGGLLGGIGGGLAQNYMQSGNLFQTGSAGQGMFSFGSNASSYAQTASDLGAIAPAGASSTSAAASGGIGNTFRMAGASAALGLVSSLLQGKPQSAGSPLSGDQISANRLAMEQQQQSEISSSSKPAMMELNPQGGYSITGYGTASTRRFSNGGDVSTIDMGQGANLSPLARYANGGEVLPANGSPMNSDSPKIEINITINNDGSSSSDSKSSSDKSDTDTEFATKMGKAVEGKVMEVLNKERRVGGSLSKQGSR